MPAEILKVGFQFVDFPEEHPPRDSPFDRARFVKTEIDAAEIAQQEEDLIQGCVRRYSLFGLRPFIRAKDLYVGRNALDRKSTRLNSSHGYISYAVFCLKKK